MIYNMSTVSGSFERVEQQIPTTPSFSLDVFPLEFLLLCSITMTIVWILHNKLKGKA